MCDKKIVCYIQDGNTVPSNGGGNGNGTTGCNCIRQTVIDGQKDANGNSNFIVTGTGLQAILKASSSTPIIITAADGFSAQGVVNYTAALTADTAISVTANTTNYLYADYDKIAATWSFGTTTVPPVYGRVDITPASGQSFFNIAKMKMTGTTNSVSTGNTLNILNDGSCKAFYKFDGNTNDETGAYNATASNVTYDVGKFDQAVKTAGTTSSYVQTGYVTPAAFTISGWVKAVSNLSTPANGYFGNNTNATNYIRGFYVSSGVSSADSQIAITFGNGSTQTSMYKPINCLNDFVFVSVVVKGATGLDFYVNGTLVGSDNVQTISSGYPIALGNQGDSSRYSNALFDQFRIFNRALTASEVSSVYAEQKSVVGSQIRVYLGEAVTGASSITSVISYAFNGEYDSGLFAVSANMSYVRNHNLGILGSTQMVYIADDASGTNERPCTLWVAGGYNYGYLFKTQTTNTSNLGTGEMGVGLSTSGAPIASAYYRLQCKRSWGK